MNKWKAARDVEHENLIKISIKKLETDSSVYILNTDSRIVYLTSLVDVLLFLSLNIEHIRCVYDKLSECYSMTFESPFHRKSDNFTAKGDRKNCYGYCFQLERTSGMFINVCKRSTLIAQSSTEAELYALAEACRELLWIRSFLGELQIPIVCETIYQDNTTTINMVKQDGMSERSKHIDVKFNFVKRLVRDKLVICPHIATKEMVADIFTKDLPDELFGGHSVTVLGRVQECTSTGRVQD